MQELSELVSRRLVTQSLMAFSFPIACGLRYRIPHDIPFGSLLRKDFSFVVMYNAPVSERAQGVGANILCGNNG